MNNELFEKYKNEMMKMYNSVHKNDAIPVANNITPVAETTTVAQNEQNGKLLGMVTSFNSLYPIENAKVTIFSGEYEDMTVIDADLTDRSGRTKVFILPTPDKNLSMAPDLTEKPYATYNMLVESDGFLKNIHLNIPVFSGITSIQRSDLIIDADQSGSEPQIFDEGQKYNL